MQVPIHSAVHLSRVAAAALLSLHASTAHAGLNPAAGKIKHVIVIMQENHSFDNYFGTFPGANGIPAGVCVPDPAAHKCVRPFASNAKQNVEGPHSHQAALLDIDGGKMDGFIGAAEQLEKNRRDPSSVMRYHTEAELPNYWSYARHFVLQDNLFSSVSSWSLPAHLYMMSAWSAQCERGKPMTCRSDLDQGRQWQNLQGEDGGRNVVEDCRQCDQLELRGGVARLTI